MTTAPDTSHSLGVRAAAARRGLTITEYLAKVNSGLKWCRTCAEWRPLADYKPSTSTHDGVLALCTRHYVPRKPLSHGYAGYQRGCRCADCNSGHTRYEARKRAERRADPARADRAGHGKATTYNNYGCRCPACKDAQSAKNAAYRQARKERQSA